MSHATVIASGTKIAEEIGTSRSEVWRLIQQLRTLGVDIAGHPATGYQLARRPRPAAAGMIAPLVKGTIFAKPDAKISSLLQDWFHQLRGYECRMPKARPRAASFWPKSSWLAAAAAPTLAFGTLGGNLLLGILRPPIPPSDALLLSLAAGLAVHAAVADSRLRLAVDLKWPNDLLLGGKKFCGILTEMNAEATRVRLPRHRHRNQCQSDKISRRPARDRQHRCAPRPHRVVARRTLRRFAKIARPRISRPSRRWIGRPRFRPQAF